MDKKAIISARDVEIQFSLRGRTLKIGRASCRERV